MNPNFNSVGEAFVKLYYSTFDENRANLRALYRADSMLTFEGTQLQGADAIVAKLMSLPFTKVQHIITLCDCQPTRENGVLVCVLGQLKADNDPPHTFNQTFHLIPVPGDPAGSYFVHNDIFRLALHHS